MKAARNEKIQGPIGYGEAREARRLRGFHQLLEAVMEREADEWARQEEARVVVLDLPERMRVGA